jgi:hypothetical protein
VRARVKFVCARYTKQLLDEGNIRGTVRADGNFKSGSGDAREIADAGVAAGKAEADGFGCNGFDV